MNQDKEKEVVRVFVASSVQEFEVERRQIAEYFDTLNQAHERDGVRLVWYRPETMSRALVRGSSQLPVDKEIKKCRFFVLLIGQRLGKYTEEEFNLALKCFQETGKPLIFPYFLNVRADIDVLRFQERFRKECDSFYLTFDNLDMVLNHLHIELIRAGAFQREDAELSDREAAADKGLDGIRELIREQQERIAELDAQRVTPLIIREKTAVYEEIQRLVQKYMIEPNTLDDYIRFLWKQHLYDAGIDIGHWLERFYAFQPPDDETLAKLKYKIAVCYHESNRYEEGEQYYRDALEIYQRLTVDSSSYEQYIAMIFGNLGLLLEGKSSIDDVGTKIPVEIESKLPYEGANPYIFVSYSHHDSHKVTGILKNMANHGYRIWYDEGIPWSSEWGKIIANHIINCEVFIIFLSNQSAISSNCSDEIHLARRKKRQILSIYLENVELPPDLEMWLSRFQSVRLSAYDDITQFIEQSTQAKETLGICQDAQVNRAKDVGQYYQNALNIWQKLALKSPSTPTPEMANIYNNIGILLQSTNRVGNSDCFYREALEEEYYRRALNIWRYLCHLSKAGQTAYEADVATTCNNLGRLLYTSNRKEDAEVYYREALEIRRHLAEANPDAFEPDVATICYNLALIESERGNKDKARNYFKEALALNERFPYRVKNTQLCRDALSRLE